MSSETRIEAAERLREILGRVPNPGIAKAIFDAALADERRATVMLIRERLEMRDVAVGPVLAYSKRSVRDVLDGEAWATLPHGSEDDWEGGAA